MKRKLFSYFAASLVLAFTLTACGSSTQTDEQNMEETTGETGTEAYDGPVMSSEEEALVDSEMEADLAVIGSEYEDYQESLSRMDGYTIDGVTFDSGAVLNDMLQNGWEFSGVLFGEVSAEDADGTIAGMDMAGVQLTSASGSSMEVDLMNPDSDEDAALKDCVVTFVGVDSSQGQSIQSFEMNGVPVWEQTQSEVSFNTDITTGENGILLYYFTVEDAAEEPSADASLTGWSLMTNDLDGDGLVDWINLSADFIYY